MALSSSSQLTPRSPFAALASAAPTAVSQRDWRETVGLGHFSDQGLIHIRGRDSRSAVEQVFGKTAAKVGDVVQVADGTLVCLRPDLLVLLTAQPADALPRLQAAPSERLLTVTDVTHGYGFMLLAGGKAAQVLPKVCGLNFSDAQFPNRHAAQTRLAKVNCLIIRDDRGDLPAYLLIVERSLAVYVWGVVQDATREFSGAILPGDTLDTLISTED